MNLNTNRKFNTLFLILLKAAILVLIVLCIFFIAYPHACMNLITGRESMEPSISEINRTLTPANSSSAPQAQPSQANTPVLQQPQEQEQYYNYEQTSPLPPTTYAPEHLTPEQEAILKQQLAAQDAFDYEVIKRYVQIEKEYLAQHPNDKNTASFVTNQVMKEKGLTAQDWQEIVLKANEKGWFKELRELAK